ncbi:MAG: hypothetical protein R3B09_05585 [Nannocystaceae bacterium]
MTPKDLAEFFALLSILEPDTITCKLAARLATAGTATDGETDTAVIKELREHAESIEKELATVAGDALEKKTALVSRFIEAVHKPAS